MDSQWHDHCCYKNNIFKTTIIVTIMTITRQHAVIFSPAQNSQKTAPVRTTPEKNAPRGPRPRGRLLNKMPHFFVFFLSRWPWPLTLTFELRWDFCTMHLIAKFRHPTFNCSEVIVLPNKQMPPKTSTLLRNATLVGNHSCCYCYCYCYYYYYYYYCTNRFWMA